MPLLLKGALIEYGGDFLGPIPNVVIFQFNPEKLTRNIQIPPRPGETVSRETTQAGEPSVERITIQAFFSAADQLNTNNALARASGIGPRLAALEQMAHPSKKVSGLIGKALDTIGDALGVGGGDIEPTQSIPRESYPRILFIWGPLRVLPVIIASMTITEMEYDFVLNPVRAEVNIGLVVNMLDDYRDDPIGKGALEYTSLVKEAQALANLANTAEQVVDLIPF
jgi:hypothetical protein